MGWVEPYEQVDEEYDLHLNNGRLLEHFHEGNMTYRVNGIKGKAPDTWIEISPALAAEAKDRNWTLGGIDLSSWADPCPRSCNGASAGQQLYLPMNSSDIAVNRLTGSHTDRATHTPAYKETAVKMRLLDEMGESPMPRGNSALELPLLSVGWRSSGSGHERITECREASETPDRNHSNQQSEKNGRSNSLSIDSRDPREKLYSRLEAAPAEHIQALLAVYDILQGLHDRVLDALRGVLIAGDFFPKPS